jgi:hypothetical protein
MKVYILFKGGTEDDSKTKEIREDYIVVDEDLGNEDAICVQLENCR